MRASRGRPAYPPPGVRACDADRERVIVELRDRFADGSLAQESFVLRVDAALRARWDRELADILADLPPPRVPLAQAALGRLAQAGRGTLRRLARRRQPPELVLPSGTKESFTIGRDASCDLVLSDMTVSRAHAGLHRRNGGWLLSDAGSTNGTRVNGWRVTEPVPVRPGDKVSFGTMSLVVTSRAQRVSTASTP
jgi:hypothetical protein